MTEGFGQTNQQYGKVFTPNVLGVPHQVALAAAIYLNPNGINPQGSLQSAPHSGIISARNSNKRQPRLFINVNNNASNANLAASHHKRQPILGLGNNIGIGGSFIGNGSSSGIVSANGNTIMYDSQLSDTQRRKQGLGTSNAINTTNASHSQVPQLTHMSSAAIAGNNATSIDSRGNQSSTSNTRSNPNTTNMQVINRKFIHFHQQQQQQNQQSSRAATHSQKRQQQNLMMLPLTQVNQQQQQQYAVTEQSPRDAGAPSSGRSGRSGKSTGAPMAEMMQTRGPMNGRLSQRKSQGAVKFPGQNAVSAPHHQLGYRRQQIMDITEDSNTNSKNKLTLGSGGGHEETMNSVESDRGHGTQDPTIIPDQTPTGPAYSMFYHSNGNQPPSSQMVQNPADSINRFNSKKNLISQKQHNNKLDFINSPYSNTSGLTALLQQVNNTTATITQQVPPSQFQFTRKQTLMNGENSLSATRGGVAGDTAATVKVVKLKKPQQTIKVNVQRDSMQTLSIIPQQQQSQSIGKRRPLIIRKNNYVTTGNGGSNERGSLKEIDNSPFNKTSNFNTLMNAGGTNQRLNNTNSFVGINSEVSLMQNTTGNPKNNTGTGISHILKNLNQTLPSEETLAQISNNKLSMQQLSLKDAKLIRNNMSKKKLDTARKSRLHQIHAQDQPEVFVYNSLSQQPESRQPNPLSLMTKKKRSLLLPKGKQPGDASQISSEVNHTVNSNGSQNASLNNMLINRPPPERRQATKQEQTSKSEEHTVIIDTQVNNNHNAIQQPKILSRGQIMRMQKLKQQQQVAVGLTNYDGSLKHHRNSTTENNGDQPSPITGASTQRLLPNQKSAKSLRNLSENSEAQKNGGTSLPRVESKKDLQYMFNGPNQSSGVNLEKHFVKEELIILENIHDSSGTPGDFQFQSIGGGSGAQTSTNLPQITGKLVQIKEEVKKQQTHAEQAVQLNQPSITDDSKAYEESENLTENSQNINIKVGAAAPAIIIQNQSEQVQAQQTNVSFGSGQKQIKSLNNTQITSTGQKSSAIQFSHVKGPGPEVAMIPITEEDVTQDTSNNAQRLLNSSIAQVKSPILTTTSFKSQNSQQAGPNHDEIIVRIFSITFQKFPMRPGKALKLFLNQLTDFEKGEILDYQEIYFLGIGAQKVQGSPKEEYNYGYDDEKGDYKVVVKDHIGYRYEILAFIGKGSFGTALKCFDHKTKAEVALKIVKNKKKYAYQAGIELKILNFLKENDPDDIMNVIHMKDYVIFRKHLCISFELLSMNLFEFLKINDFNGFDHNLIRRFAIQLLYALKYLREFQIIHCDLKPENILLKEANKSGIKIIDFGSSTFLDERVYTYIQSRFYRAPEIMLGIPYTCAIDMWSFGCIMAELYIGYPIFPGESENDQMSRIIEMVNIPQQHVYDISQRRAKFFTENQETGDYEPIMMKNSRGKLRKPGGKPLTLLLGDEDLDFLDFVTKCLEWDPETRLTPDEALRHIWILKGLPPQVLVHHQRMHNIATPELPLSVREARDQFFLQISQQQQQQQDPGTLNQSNGSGGKANTSQLGGSNRFTSSGGKTNSGAQQQSMNQAKATIQTGGGTQNIPNVKASIANLGALQSQGNTKQLQNTSNIKAETIKSLERAQLKNQLHQANAVLSNKGAPVGQNITLHSKIQLPPTMFQDSHRSDQVVITSTNSNSNTARLQQQLALIAQQQKTQQQFSPNKTGIVVAAGTLQNLNDSTQNVKAALGGFRRRNHQAAARHQRNANLAQRPHDAFTN